MPSFFESRRELRSWFAAHRSRALQVKIGFRVRPNGHACISFEEAAEEALCYGWGAGRRTDIDPKTYAVTFKPILTGARWSDADMDLARALIDAKRMTKAGKTAFESRLVKPEKAPRTEGAKDEELSPSMLAEFKRHALAWTQFQRMPPSHQRKWTSWVMAAKQEATRSNRFAKLLLDLGKPR